MFPFHTWLPDAHVEAPTAGFRDSGQRFAENGGRTGFLRFSVPLLPDAAKDHTIVTVMACFHHRNRLRRAGVSSHAEGLERSWWRTPR